MGQSSSLSAGQRVVIIGGQLSGLLGSVAFLREWQIVVELDYTADGLYIELPAHVLEATCEV